MRAALILPIVLIIGTVNLMGLFSSKAENEKNLICLTSSGVTGLYYPTAGSIANSVNQKRNEYGFRITIKLKRSSVSILNRVISGEIFLGEVMQSRIYQAFNGLADWEGSPQTDLCSVFNTHAEYITLIASIGSGIKTILDLKDKRVGFGSPGSDLHYNAIDILTAVGINYETDLSVIDDRMEALPDLLQDDDIDAFFYPVGTLNRPFVALVSGTEKVRLVSIAAPGIDALIAANPFYERALVPMTLYPSLDDNAKIEALAVKTSLITSCRIPNETVYIVTKETVEKFESIRKRYSTALRMTRKKMVEGLQAPVHPGAMKYYKESGLDAMIRP